MSQEEAFAIAVLLTLAGNLIIIVGAGVILITRVIDWWRDR